MFSPHVTIARSPASRTSTSVRKNWMYGVFARMTEKDRRMSVRPRSAGQPGCTHEASTAAAPSTQTAASRSMSADSTAV
jgi:hypothetical protein